MARYRTGGTPRLRMLGHGVTAVAADQIPGIIWEHSVTNPRLTAWFPVLEGQSENRTPAKSVDGRDGPK
jgi:hypothetical protein